MEQLTSVEKAVDVLFHLHREATAQGVTAVGRALGLPKSSAHRLLASLCRRGLVERDASGCYRPGSALAALALGALEREAAAARPVIEEQARGGGRGTVLGAPGAVGPGCAGAADPRGGEAARDAVVWLDGRVVGIGEARIPVTDHGLLYGDGIFEGIRVYCGRVFRLDRHIARFAAAARQIGLALPGGAGTAREVVLAALRAYGRSEAYARLIATRGEGALGVDPSTCERPRLLCIAGRVSIYPEAKLRAGIDLVTVSVRRPPADVLDPRVKSLNYLNNALAKLEARRRGADEALLLNAAGMVAEASVANVFAHRDGVLLTPPATDGALEGVTRATVLELASQLGIPARERTLGRFDLFSADEVFLTGTGAGLVLVRSLDGALIGAGAPGPVFEKTRLAFAEATRALGVPLDPAVGEER